MCPPVLIEALIRVTLCFLSSHASKKRSFFLVSQARSTSLRVNRSCPRLSVVYSAGGHAGPPLQRVTRLIVTRFALTQWTHDYESIQILVLQHLMAGFVVLM